MFQSWQIHPARQAPIPHRYRDPVAKLLNCSWSCIDVWNLVRAKHQAFYGNASQPVFLFYALGDAGFNFFWVLSDTFLPFYLETAAAFSSIHVKFILVAGRGVDILMSLLFAFTIGRSSSSRGRFRPYLLWSSVPLACCTMLLFSVGPISETSAVTATIVATLAYSGFVISYSAGNIAYTAMPALLVASEEDCTRLVGARFFAASLVNLLLNTSTLAMVALAGPGRQSAGWRLTAFVYSLCGCFLLLCSFWRVRERQYPASKAIIPQANACRQLGALWKPLTALYFVVAALTCRSTTALIYVQENLQHGGHCGMFLAAASVPSIAACYAVARHRLSARNRHRAIVLCSGAAAGVLPVFFYLTAKSWDAALLMQVLYGAVTGALFPLLFAVITPSCAADSNSTAVGANGLIATGVLFMLKAGSFTGAWIGTSILTQSHFRSGVALLVPGQRDLAWSVSWVPAALFMTALVIFQGGRVQRSRI